MQHVAIEHGCIPYGTGKARAVAWNLPDPVPVHREPNYSLRVDLVSKYPTRPVHRQPGDVISGDRVIGRDPDPFIRGETLRHYHSG